jgi:MoxR-like ATPase
MNLASLFNLIHSGCSIISIDAPSVEEDTIIEGILEEAEENKYEVAFWTFGRSIQKLKLAIEDDEVSGVELGTVLFKPTNVFTPSQEVCAVLDWIESYGISNSSSDPNVRIVFILADIQKLITEQAGDLSVSRRIKSLALSLERLEAKKRIILLGQDIKLPVSFAGLVEDIKVDLPTIAEIRRQADYITNALIETHEIEVTLTAEEKDGLIRALQGLTLQEISKSIRLGVRIYKKIDNGFIDFVQQRKIEKFKKLGVEVSPPPDVAIAGLNEWQNWAANQIHFFSEEAAHFNIKPPSGAVLVGIPGTGKSLAAKCLAQKWKIPVLSVNIGSVLSSHVGQSEERFRQILKTAESVAPCALFIDELEKAFAGVGSGSQDTGIMDRIFGTLLTWLNDKQAPVFLIAAANSVKKLPPEFLRKGRFDEIFFVGLPTLPEREDIFRIHCQNKRLAIGEGWLSELAQLTQNYVGSEIAAIVHEAQKSCFLRVFAIPKSSKDLIYLSPTIDDFKAAISNCRPLYESRAEEIKAMVTWGEENARNASSAILPANEALAQALSLDIAKKGTRRTQKKNVSIEV